MKTLLEKHLVLTDWVTMVFPVEDGNVTSRVAVKEVAASSEEEAMFNHDLMVAALGGEGGGSEPGEDGTCASCGGEMFLSVRRPTWEGKVEEVCLECNLYRQEEHGITVRLPSYRIEAFHHTGLQEHVLTERPFREMLPWLLKNCDSFIVTKEAS